MPSFTIIMPVYNAEKTVNAAIESVLSQLSDGDELLLVDDASTDGSLDLLVKIVDKRVKLLKHSQNQGISGARNTALPHVKGDYIAFMDADDLWPIGRHALVKDVIAASAPDIISGMVEHFYCPSLNETEAAKFKLPETQQASMPGSMVFSRECIQRAGKFDVSLKVGEFIDFVSRIKQQGVSSAKINVPLLKRRIHGENHTLKNRSKQADYLKVIRKHMERTCG